MDGGTDKKPLLLSQEKQMDPNLLYYKLDAVLCFSVATISVLASAAAVTGTKRTA